MWAVPSDGQRKSNTCRRRKLEQELKIHRVGSLELEGTGTNFRIFCNIGKDAWFPTVCGMGIQGNFI